MGLNKSFQNFMFVILKLMILTANLPKLYLRNILIMILLQPDLCLKRRKMSRIKALVRVNPDIEKHH